MIMHDNNLQIETSVGTRNFIIHLRKIVTTSNIEDKLEKNGQVQL